MCQIALKLLMCCYVNVFSLKFVARYFCTVYLFGMYTLSCKLAQYSNVSGIGLMILFVQWEILEQSGEFGGHGNIRYIGQSSGNCQISIITCHTYVSCAPSMLYFTEGYNKYKHPGNAMKSQAPAVPFR